MVTMIKSIRLPFNCRLNHAMRLCHQFSPDPKEEGMKGGPNLFSTHEKALQLIINSMSVLDDFVSEEQESSLLKETEPYLKRLRYESSHWDKAILSYRETEKSHWNEINAETMRKVRETSLPAGYQPLPHVHVLDLAKEGVIKPHIDSVRFCGAIIAGLSLLSSSVMRLVHEEDKEMVVDVLLKRRSLYIMKDEARFKFTHEILGAEESLFRGRPVERERRVSIIVRCEPDHTEDEADPHLDK